MEKDNKLINKRLANAFISSVVSISLVLLLVGVASLLLVNARVISNYFKENMQVSVMMHQFVQEEDALFFMKNLEKESFIRSAKLISREQGTKEMMELLGEDFLNVFETSPIPISINLSLNAQYVSSDSLAVIKDKILQSDMVESLEYQKSLVDALNANLNKISLILSVLIALLLFISYVLINNTVRLSVYARRFTIHTMQLVGATASFIRRPFMLQAVFQGLFSALISIIVLISMLYIIRNEFTQLFTVFTLDNLLIVIGIVVIFGLFICLLSTFFVVKRLISVKRAELYY